MPSRTRSIAAVLFSSVILVGAGDATASADAHHVSRHHAPAAHTHTHKHRARRHHARRHHRKGSEPTASAARAGRAGAVGITLGKGKGTIAPPRNVATTVTSTVTTQTATSTQQSTPTPPSTETLPTTTTTSTTSTTPAASTSTSTSGSSTSGSSGSSTSNGLTCGGEVPAPLPGGNPWQCTFDDEFNASTGDPTSLNRSEWVPQTTAQSGFSTGPSDAKVCYVDSPDTINVANGALNLTVRQTSAPFDCGGQFTTEYEGGMVSTWHQFNQTYGRYEVRALLPQTDVAGLQETLWLWPQNQTAAWPGSGEIDMSEFYSYENDLDIPFVHYDFDSDSVSSDTDTNIDTNYCKIDPTQYNDYALTWEPGSITVQINGADCLVDNYQADGSDSKGPFDNPFFINLTQALGMYGADTFQPGTTPLPATMSIQYVRVWQ